MSGKFKKIYILFLLTILLSCSGKDKEEKIEITFWHSFVANTRPALVELINEYEKENPDVKIVEQYVPSGDPLVQKLITAIQSKTTPDISWIHSDFLDKLIEADAIFNLDQFVNSVNGFSKEELEDFFPQLLAGAKWNDTLYALPVEATTLALLYNKDLFKKAGLDPNYPPKDWKELKEFSQKLTFDEDGDGKIDHYGFYVPALPASGPLSIWVLLQWEPFIWQAGGSILNSDHTEATFNSRAGIKALSLWKKIYDKVGFVSFSLSHDLSFISQKCAMIMDGPWNLPAMRSIKNFEWGIAPLPKGPEKRATYIAGEHLAIFKNSKYPDEAWNFIKWFSNPETQAKFSTKSGYLPVRKSTLELPEYKKHLETDPKLAAFVEQFKIGYARQQIKHHRMEINQKIAGAIEKTLLGNTDPETALNDAAEEVNSLLNQDK